MPDPAAGLASRHQVEIAVAVQIDQGDRPGMASVQSLAKREVSPAVVQPQLVGAVVAHHRIERAVAVHVAQGDDQTLGVPQLLPAVDEMALPIVEPDGVGIPVSEDERAEVAMCHGLQTEDKPLANQERRFTAYILPVGQEGVDGAVAVQIAEGYGVAAPVTDLLLAYYQPALPVVEPDFAITVVTEPGSCRIRDPSAAAGRENIQSAVAVQIGHGYIEQ